jgi:transcriptional regulator with XRE-family HTH domain
MNLIGPNIREIRKRQNLSQKDLVARCNLLGWGISRGTLAKIESRTRKISDEEVLYFVKALKTEVGKLFAGTSLNDLNTEAPPFVSE